MAASEMNLASWTCDKNDAYAPEFKRCVPTPADRGSIGQEVHWAGGTPLSLSPSPSPNTERHLVVTLAMHP